MYKVLIEDKGMTWRRHVNQLKTRLASWSIPDSVQPTSQPVDISQLVDTLEPEPSERELVPLRRSSRVPKPRRPWSPSNH